VFGAGNQAATLRAELESNGRLSGDMKNCPRRVQLFCITEHNLFDVGVADAVRPYDIFPTKAHQIDFLVQLDWAPIAQRARQPASQGEGTGQGKLGWAARLSSLKRLFHDSCKKNP
jgi:hypothetical protein